MLTQNEKVKLREKVDAAKYTATALAAANNSDEFDRLAGIDEAAWRELFRFIKEDL